MNLFCIVLAYSYLCNRKQLIMINMTITERFLNYVKFDTQSSEESTTVPSTSKQLIFAKYLKEELEREGFADVEMDEMGYIYATLKSNTKKEVPTIGFISHYDTSPDCSGADIKPSIVSNYNGSDIELSPGIISSPKKFPELLQHVGEDLIVTDGTTLLGADDKAGIAEIVQACATIRRFHMAISVWDSIPMRRSVWVHIISMWRSSAVNGLTPSTAAT